MNTTCRWVRGTDGALVLEWARADDSAVEQKDSEGQEADAFEAVFAFMELNHVSDTLTPVGV